MDPKYTRATGGPPLRFRWQSVLHVGFIYKLRDRARSQSRVPRFVILFHYYDRHGIGMSLFLLEPSSRKFTKKKPPEAERRRWRIAFIRAGLVGLHVRAF